MVGSIDFLRAKPFQKFLDGFFEADKDSSAYLTSDEVGEKAVFSVFDRNKDRKLSLHEILEGLERSPLGFPYNYFGMDPIVSSEEAYQFLNHPKLSALFQPRKPAENLRIIFRLFDSSHHELSMREHWLPYSYFLTFAQVLGAFQCLAEGKDLSTAIVTTALQTIGSPDFRISLGAAVFLENEIEKAPPESQVEAARKTLQAIKRWRATRAFDLADRSPPKTNKQLLADLSYLEYDRIDSFLNTVAGKLAESKNVPVELKEEMLARATPESLPGLFRSNVSEQSKTAALAALLKKAGSSDINERKGATHTLKTLAQAEIPGHLKVQLVEGAIPLLDRGNADIREGGVEILLATFCSHIDAKLQETITAQLAQKVLDRGKKDETAHLLKQWQCFVEDRMHAMSGLDRREHLKQLTREHIENLAHALLQQQSPQLVEEGLGLWGPLLRTDISPELKQGIVRFLLNRGKANFAAWLVLCQEDAVIPPTLKADIAANLAQDSYQKNLPRIPDRQHPLNLGPECLVRILPFIPTPAGREPVFGAIDQGMRTVSLEGVHFGELLQNTSRLPIPPPEKELLIQQLFPYYRKHLEKVAAHARISGGSRLISMDKGLVALMTSDLPRGLKELYLSSTIDILRKAIRRYPKKYRETDEDPLKRQSLWLLGSVAKSPCEAGLREKLVPFFIEMSDDREEGTRERAFAALAKTIPAMVSRDALEKTADRFLASPEGWVKLVGDMPHDPIQLSWISDMITKKLSPEKRLQVTDALLIMLAEEKRKCPGNDYGPWICQRLKSLFDHILQDLLRSGSLPPEYANKIQEAFRDRNRISPL